MAEEAARRLSPSAPETPRVSVQGTPRVSVRGTPRARLRRWLLAGGTFLVALLLVSGNALAQAKKKPPPAWAELSPAKQKILAPLAGEWDRLDAANRARWLGVAKRYPGMTPVGQKRTQSRMEKWAKLTPKQREEARDKYRRLKEKEDEDLRGKWQQYQSLPPAERQALTAPAKPPADRGRAQRRQDGRAPAAKGK